jgi:RNA polymerase sigma factor (sigma-70 family)
MSAFEVHRPRLTALARSWLGSHADAEDLVQDAWLRALGRLPDSPGEDAAWLVTVVRHLCSDRLRRRRLEQRHAVDDPSGETHAPSAEHLAERSMDASATLRRLVQRLQPQDVAAVLLHAAFDFEHADIARLSRRTEAASRQRLHRALRRLREPVPDEREVRDHAEMLLSLCWRALQTHDASALTALLARPQATACAPAPAAIDAPTPRSHATLLQSNGRYMLAVQLDGIVLCTLPLGVLDTPVAVG